jgi:hypothetical protein
MCGCTQSAPPRSTTAGPPSSGKPSPPGKHRARRGEPGDDHRPARPDRPVITSVWIVVFTVAVGKAGAWATSHVWFVVAALVLSAGTAVMALLQARRRRNAATVTWLAGQVLVTAGLAVAVPADALSNEEVGLTGQNWMFQLSGSLLFAAAFAGFAAAVMVGARHRRTYEHLSPEPADSSLARSPGNSVPDAAPSA